MSLYPGVYLRACVLWINAVDASTAVDCHRDGAQDKEQGHLKNSNALA